MQMKKIYIKKKRNITEWFTKDITENVRKKYLKDIIHMKYDLTAQIMIEQANDQRFINDRDFLSELILRYDTRYENQVLI